MADISIVVVNYNTLDYLRECLASIYVHMPISTEVIVVDNASIDGSCAMVRTEFPQVKLIASDKNLGFGLANNLGVEHATHPYIMLFNSDAILQMDTAQALMDYLMTNPDVSCVTPRVVLPKTLEIQAKTFGFTPNALRILMQSTGLNRVFPRSQFFAGIDGDVRWSREMQVGWVSGVCMVMRRTDFLKVGGFDARFFMYCEDIELCMKLAKLGKIILLDDYDIIHYGGASSKSMAAKVRNSVWQQRHLLMIVKDYQGGLQTFISKFFILFGLLVRLCVAMLRIPQKGLQTNESLQSAWARLKDIVGMNALKQGVSR
jgi:GT2 family glycosyltransferase